MKILVATREGQGARPDDIFETEEGEIVIPVMECDSSHTDCACHRAMVGVRTGKETTTAIVVESDLTRDEYRKAVRAALTNREFAGLGVPDYIFNQQADDLLRLASELPAGRVIERVGEDFNPRGYGYGVAAD